MNEWNKQTSCAYVIQSSAEGYLSARSVVPGCGTTSQDGQESPFKGCRDTTELHVASRCITQRKSQIRDERWHSIWRLTLSNDRRHVRHNT